MNPTGDKRIRVQCRVRRKRGMEGWEKGIGNLVGAFLAGWASLNACSGRCAGKQDG